MDVREIRYEAIDYASCDQDCENSLVNFRIEQKAGHF
jgi:hypothetical protein